MLEIYKCDEARKLQEQAGSAQSSWIHFTEPTDEEIHDAACRFRIPIEFIHAPLDSNERSRIQTKDDHLLLNINVPYRTDEKDSVPYRIIPIGIIYTESLIVTICRQDHLIFRQFMKLDNKKSTFDIGTDFIIQLLQNSADYYLISLDEIDKKIIAVEKRLQRSVHNKEIYALLDLNKSLVFFKKSLKSNINAIEKLVYMEDFNSNEGDERRLQNILIELKQGLAISEIYNMNLSDLMDAYSAVIENNLNVGLKLLTVFTIISAIPMAIASIYGMNIPLPYQDVGSTFLVLMSIGVILSLITGWLFYKLRII